MIQISVANTAMKMTVTHQGPTPTGMGKRMSNNQTHHGHFIFLCGSSIIPFLIRQSLIHCDGEKAP